MDLDESEDTGDSCGEEGLAKFIVWFEMGIEGKDQMDKDEEEIVYRCRGLFYDVRR